MSEAEAGKKGAASTEANAEPIIDATAQSSCSQLQPIINCPLCGSTKIYKDGLRYLKDGTNIQRYLCYICGYRFSETSLNNSNKFQHAQNS